MVSSLHVPNGHTKGATVTMKGSILSNVGRGHALALGTILVWGTTFIASTIALRTLSPVELLILRLLIAIAALALANPHRLTLQSRKHEWYLLGAGLSGVTLYFLFEFIALTYTSSSNCSVIISSAPFFVAIATRFLLKEERLTRPFFVGFVIAMAGVCLVSFAGHTLKLNPLGDALCILAAISWAFYSVFIRKLEGYGYNMMLITRRIFIYGLLCILPVALVTGFNVTPADVFNSDTLISILFLGLIASALCFVTWNTAVRLIGPMKTSVYIYLAPPVTIVFARLILNDPIHPLAIAGAALTLLGLFISQRRAPKAVAQ
jgi:drug/metabolite transporter (DMT)-like permease